MRVSLRVSAIVLACSALPAGAHFPTIVATVCDDDLPTCSSGLQGFSGVRTVAVSADDQHVYVCSRHDDTLSALSRDAGDGSLTLVDQEIDGVGGVDTLDSCWGVAVSPDGGHVYAVAAADSAVTWFSRDAGTGALSFTAGDSLSGGPASGFSGASGVLVSPDDEHVYVASRDDDAVLAFSRDATTGDLTQIDLELDGIALVDGLRGALGLTLSPDGRHLYVASHLDHAVAVFARETDSGSASFGELTFLEAHFDGAAGVDGLRGASSVAVSGDGAHVYVSSIRGVFLLSGGDDWLAAFERSAATGALTFLEGIDEDDFSGIYDPCTPGATGNEKTGVAVSPDGLFVFVTNPYYGMIATFSRAVDGTVSLADSICDLSLGADGIAGVVGIAVSADGKNAYSASSTFMTVAALDTVCDAADVDLVLGVPPASEGGTVTEDACRSITAFEYTILVGANVTLEAPVVVLANGFEARGDSVIRNAVPHD